MVSSRFPDKLSALQILKECNLPVSTIIDIGVNQQTHELIQVFPETKQLLFEPVTEFNTIITDNYKKINYELFNIALSDVSDSAFLEVMCFTDSQKITHSRVSIEDAHQQNENIRKINTISLDDFLTDKNYEKPYLLKIDVDFGNDIKILKGAINTLRNVSCVIIEASVDKLGEEIKFLEDQGFYLWDIVDLCYFWKTLNQVDLIFLNYSLWPNPRFYPAHIENPWDSQYIAENYCQLVDTVPGYKTEIAEYKIEISNLKLELNHLSKNAANFNSRIRQYEEDIQNLKSEIQGKKEIYTQELSDLKLELHKLSHEIQVMKTSKCWKMRDIWFSLKHLGKS